MDGGAIFEYDGRGRHFTCTRRTPSDEETVAAPARRRSRKVRGAIGGLALTGEPVQIADITDEGIIRAGSRDPHPSRLSVTARAAAAQTITRRPRRQSEERGRFRTEVIELLKTFATQPRPRHAERATGSRDRSEEPRAGGGEPSQRASSSPTCARAAHTLNAIIGFSEVLSERLFGEINEKQAEYIGDLLSRAPTLSLSTHHRSSKIEAGRWNWADRFQSPSTIENTLVLVQGERSGAARTCTLSTNAWNGPCRRAQDEASPSEPLVERTEIPRRAAIEVRAAVRDDGRSRSPIPEWAFLPDQEAVFEGSAGRDGVEESGEPNGLAIHASSLSFTAEGSGSRVKWAWLDLRLYLTVDGRLAPQGCTGTRRLFRHASNANGSMWPSANANICMDPSSFASTPFFGGEVRLLTYIRPLTAASI